MEQTLELMKHQIELQRKDKKNVKNRMKFIALTLVFAFLLSGCSTKRIDKNGIVTMKMKNGPTLCLKM